jgi:hypothetical protein
LVIVLKFYTTSLSIAYCLVATEDKPDDEILKRLEYLRENTHEKLNLPIAMTELIILTNLSKGLGRPIEFRDNNNKTIEMDLGRIIKYAKDSYFELAQIVIRIAKKYDVSIPMRGDTGVMDIPSFQGKIPELPSLVDK